MGPFRWSGCCPRAASGGPKSLHSWLLSECSAALSKFLSGRGRRCPRRAFVATSWRKKAIRHLGRAAMSMKVKSTSHRCWPGLLPRSRSPPHRRLPQQIISPATGAAREPSASLPATFRSRPPAPGSVSPLWRPGLAALPPLSWCVTGTASSSLASNVGGEGVARWSRKSWMRNRCIGS